MEGVVRWPVVADELKDLRTKLWLGFRKHQHNRDLFKFLWEHIKRVVVSQWAQHTGRFIRTEDEVIRYVNKMFCPRLGITTNVMHSTHTLLMIAFCALL
jgi:hypothetical protein